MSLWSQLFPDFPRHGHLLVVEVLVCHSFHLATHSELPSTFLFPAYVRDNPHAAWFFPTPKQHACQFGAMEQCGFPGDIWWPKNAEIWPPNGDDLHGKGEKITDLVTKLMVQDSLVPTLDMNHESIYIYQIYIYIYHIYISYIIYIYTYIKICLPCRMPGH